MRCDRAGAARIRRDVELPPVLVVVAVKAQQLPVAAVRRIVVVIVVTMVHGELAQISARELASTAPADPGIDLKRPLAIAPLPLLGSAARIGHEAIELAGIGSGHNAGLRIVRWQTIADNGRD